MTTFARGLGAVLSGVSSWGCGPPAAPAPAPVAEASVETPPATPDPEASGAEPAPRESAPRFAAAEAVARGLFGEGLALSFADDDATASFVPPGYGAEVAQELDFDADGHHDRVIVLGRNGEVAPGEAPDCVMILALAKDQRRYQVAGVNGHRFGCDAADIEDPMAAPSTSIRTDDEGATLVVEVQGSGMLFSYTHSYVVGYEPSTRRFLLEEFSEQNYDRRAMQGESVQYRLLDGRGSATAIPSDADPVPFAFPPRRLYFEDLSEAIVDDLSRFRPAAP